MLVANPCRFGLSDLRCLRPHIAGHFLADLHRVKSSPWPSSGAKAAAKAQIEKLAEAGEPNIESAIEYGSSSVGFAMTSLSSLVRAGEAALAFTETTDTLGLLCWLLKDQLLAKIYAAIDAAADDKVALSAQQREELEAQITSDKLLVERSECSLIWIAEAQGEVIDFRAGTTPQALLGLRLVNRPRALPSGSSPEHAWDVILPGSRR